MLGLSIKAQVGLGLAWLLVGLLIGLLWLFNRPGIEIVWQTETEFDSAGFNILRGNTKQGPFVEANDQLIPASDDAAAGADYSYLDTDVIGGQRYYYQLEDVDLGGNKTQHTPLSYEAPVKSPWILAISVVLILFGLILILSVRKGY